MSEESGFKGSGRAVLERALRFKDKLKRGGLVHGAWLTVADPAVAEIMAGIGFDSFRCRYLRHASRSASLSSGGFA
jgi:2-keto-3-deoxy-L-rhamnonate aldolase RhmA